MPSFAIAASSFGRCETSVEQSTRPITSGCTPVRSSSSTSPPGNRGARSVSSPVAVSITTAPFSTTIASKRSPLSKTDSSSARVRPVTRISRMPASAIRSSAAIVAGEQSPSVARVPS